MIEVIYFFHFQPILVKIHDSDLIKKIPKPWFMTVWGNFVNKKENQTFSKNEEHLFWVFTSLNL